MCKPKTKEYAEKIRQANLGRKDYLGIKISATKKCISWTQARRDAQAGIKG